MIFKKMFKKNPMYKITELNSYPSGTREFGFTMEFIKEALKHEKTKHDKTIILDFVISIVKQDLQSDMLTKILYNEKHFEINNTPLFPRKYYDEGGGCYRLEEDINIMKKVDLSKDCVVVLPWDRNRMKYSIKRIYQEGFKFHPSNHFATYFSYVGICYVTNGYHSITSGIGYKQGYIEATVCDIEPLFKHIYTDGANWYNQHNKKILDPLFDFRVGIVFELVKLGNQILDEGEK